MLSINKGQMEGEGSWQREKEGAQRKDSSADMQLDGYKAPVSVLPRCLCQCIQSITVAVKAGPTGIFRVRMQLLHTNLTPHLPWLSWIQLQGNTSEIEGSGKKRSRDSNCLYQIRTYSLSRWSVVIQIRGFPCKETNVSMLECFKNLHTG